MKFKIADDFTTGEYFWFLESAVVDGVEIVVVVQELALLVQKF
jgi:hypothetical protein